MTNTTTNTVANNTAAPQRFYIIFNSIESANAWLYQQRTIVITKIDVHTKSRFSFPANNLVVTELRIEYLQYPFCVNHFYGIGELDYTTVYASAKLENLKKRWTSYNPDKEYLYSVKFSTRRSLMGTQFGFISFVKNKLVVLYKY